MAGGAPAATCCGCDELPLPNIWLEMPWPMTDPAIDPAIDEPIIPIMLGPCGAAACIGGGAACIGGRAIGGGAGAGAERLLLRPKPIVCKFVV